MKKFITPYLFSLTFVFGGFLLVSLLLVSLSYFITFSSSTYSMMILILSYMIIIGGSDVFIRFTPSKPLIHSIVFAIIYLIFSYLAANGVTHLLHLILKPTVFVGCCVLWSVFKKETKE